jgi:hypothetical protein
MLAVVFRFFRAIGDFLYKVREAIELTFIVWPIEIVMRLWYHLDPRVYSRGMRIKAIEDGQPLKPGGRFVIFVLFARNSLPEFTKNAIDALSATDLNLIIVSNATVDAGVRAGLEGKYYKIIERKNIGRDVGAYQDGLLYLLEQHPDASRIIMMNDSVYFLKRNSLDKLIADLSGPQDFIGALENHEYRYHVQSFMLSFGRSVIEHPAFVRFWTKFRPISTRRWAIHRGEIDLTRAITRAGFRPHIIYQAAHLLPILHKMTAREVVETTQLLPQGVRDELFYNFLPYMTDAGSLSDVRAISAGIRRIRSSPVRPDGAFSRLSVEAAALEQWSVGIFPDLVVEMISEHNQTHFGGFLFMKYLGLPIIKRDLFNREIQSLEDVYQFLTSMDEPLRDEILGDMRRSGSGANLRGLTGILHRNGSI